MYKISYTFIARKIELLFVDEEVVQHILYNGYSWLYVIKFRNAYYKIYNHWDSYPSELGKKVIEGFAQPQAAQNLDSLPRIPYGNPSTNDVLKTLQEHNELEQSEECLKAIIQYFVTTCKNEVVEEDGQLSFLIEWIYKMDLDQLQLTVENWDKKKQISCISGTGPLFSEIESSEKIPRNPQIPLNSQRKEKVKVKPKERSPRSKRTFLKN